MRQITADELREALNDHEPPCVSVYQPTYRSYPDNQQDPIRFRNLVKEAEASLLRLYPGREVRPLLEPFRTLADDVEFWRHTPDGLAVLASADGFRVFPLQRAVPELAVVADSFHTKPLIRFLQSADRYQVLCLSRSEAKLYEGNRDSIDEVDLAEGVPRTLTEALGEEKTEAHQGAVSSGRAGQGSPSIYHGSGSRKDEADVDTERFFRAVDRAVLEHHSRPSGLPLILAALPEHVDLARKVSHNPFLLEDGVKIDPWSLTPDRLRDEVWKAVLPHYLKRLAGLVDAFNEARSKRLGADDLTDVAQAVVADRVGTLLVEADRQVPGTFDPATGRVEFGDLAHPGVDDLLDDLAEAVLKRGGEVVVVPADRMPSRTGAAATYRF